MHKILLPILLACCGPYAGATMLSPSTPASQTVGPAPSAHDTDLGSKGPENETVRASGTITGIAPATGQIWIDGAPASFQPNTIRIYGQDGRPLSIYDIRKGQRIRYLMNHDGKTATTVRLIRLDK